MPELSEQQQAIVDATGNIVVETGAGSGKTHTMIEKIVRDVGASNDHRVVAAITFTIKASEEISSRMPRSIRGHFVNTNNSFAISEVIKPFMKNAYGDEFNFEMTVDYSTGCKFSDFEEGLEVLRKNHVIATYRNDKKNFIFELALNIIQKSVACQLYLKAKYFKLYIDEYQDSDRDMHEFFMYISDVLQIEMFVIGDAKQAIYKWRGAYPEAFQGIAQKDNFTAYDLYENHRCCLQIQNYSNLLFVKTSHLYRQAVLQGEVCLLQTDSLSWGQMVCSLLNNHKSTAVLTHTNANAKNYAKELSACGLNCVFVPNPPVNYIANESAWAYQSLAQYLLDDESSEYDFLYANPLLDEATTQMKSQIRNLLKSLASQVENRQQFDETLTALFSLIGYEPPAGEDIDRLIMTVSEPASYAICYQNLNHHCQSITYHSSKGLEFAQVVLFVEDYDLSKEDDMNNHYVASTRAKEKLILVSRNDALYQRYAGQLSNILANSTATLGDILQHFA